MKTAKLISWNVNGLRAIEKKGFVEWLNQEAPDILSIQETKCQEDQVPETIKSLPGYYSYFSSAQRKGYSGVGIFTKKKPEKVEYGIGIEKFDSEGRIIIAYYDNFILFNCYFPNGGASEERLNYKLAFYEAVLDYFNSKKGENIVICGDVNTAHQAIDLKRPKENANISGFLDVERAWVTKLLNCGFIDTFRYFHPEKVKYSWWSYRYRARLTNAGWRLDYFFADPSLKERLINADIL
ncbi:MAG: exodeoxyribonuclease III, partial [Bacillota bacterium]|nr:exodeoxyribonuclease III [Bacillota bacterium]